jgi:hypothetical protein
VYNYCTRPRSKYLRAIIGAEFVGEELYWHIYDVLPPHIYCCFSKKKKFTLWRCFFFFCSFLTCGQVFRWSMLMTLQVSIWAKLEHARTARSAHSLQAALRSNRFLEFFVEEWRKYTKVGRICGVIFAYLVSFPSTLECRLLILHIVAHIPLGEALGQARDRRWPKGHH